MASSICLINPTGRFAGKCVPYSVQHVRSLTLPSQLPAKASEGLEMHLYDCKDLVRTSLHHLQSGKEHNGGHRRKEQLIYQQLANNSCPAGRPLWQYVCLQELQEGTLNVSGGETNLYVQSRYCQLLYTSADW